MINNIKVKLEIDNNKLKIKVNEKKKGEISINNKSINTKEIYNLLQYNSENKYILDCNKLNEEDTIVKDNEINRLYNFNQINKNKKDGLFKSIIDAINEINKNDKV